MQLVRVRSLAIVSLVAAFTAAACGQGNAVLTPTGPSASLGSAALVSDASAALDASQASTAGAVAAPQRKGDKVDKGKGGGRPPKPEEGELGTPEIERGRLAGGGTYKVAVCHLTGGMKGFILIYIAAPAVSAHLAHGDLLAGDPVLGGEGATYGPDCGIVPPVDPTAIATAIATVYESPDFFCDTGAATQTDAGVRGTVTFTDQGDTIRADVDLVGALPSTTYDVWINQDPGGCPLDGPTVAGAIVTDETGAGSGFAEADVMVGAENFWVSAVAQPNGDAPPVLRSNSTSFVVPEVVEIPVEPLLP